MSGQRSAPEAPASGAASDRTTTDGGATGQHTTADAAGPAQRTTAEARVERGPSPESARAAWRRRWRAWRLWLALLAVAVLVGLFYLATGPDGDRRALSPANPAPDGAMAVAEVLRQHGVEVVAPENLDGAVAALDGGSRSTLLLHDPDGILNAGQLARLAEARSAAPGRTVLVLPGFEQLRALGPGIRPAGRVPDGTAEPLAASCGVPAGATALDAAAEGGQLYRADAGCFGVQTAAGPAYTFAVARSAAAVGHASYLDNGHILDHGHSALALRTLGAEPRLVWYRPTAADLVADGPAPNPFELLPAWTGPATVWLMLLGLAAIVWRARRDGPLVVEPLPVVVPAAETAEGRARLYQDSRAVAAAAAALRSAALTRIADHLRLGHGTTADGIIATLAKDGYRPAPELRRLLHPSLSSEAELVAWANELHHLEKEIGIP